ncbi:hypothetical protein [Levilactobacillus parabrevis]|uniref:hypothetical protein n=1 Tax=Levilactobacillus parabrevis TaxID=357278 RepID=UPI0012E36266|nr:hypothetical protein [Levilactobacillus parabrevis]
MQKISINSVLKGIVSIGVQNKDDEQAQNLMELRSRKVLVRNTFLKLLNDGNFYEQSVQSGLLQEYSRWLKDTFDIEDKKNKESKSKKLKSKRPHSTFLSRPREWGDEQLFAFIIVAFSSDIYHEELSLDTNNFEKITLDNLIMQSMGLDQPRVAIKKLNISTLKKAGLKRTVTDLNGDNAQVVLRISHEMVRRATRLAQMVSREFRYGSTDKREVTIDYRAIKSDIIIGTSGHGLQLSPYHTTADSIHILTGMISAAVDPVAPNDNFSEKSIDSDGLIKQVCEKINEISKLRDSLDDASSIVKLSTQARLTDALNELISVAAALKGVKKRS